MALSYEDKVELCSSKIQFIAVPLLSCAVRAPKEDNGLGGVLRFFKNVFYLFWERERERLCGHVCIHKWRRGRERGRERIPSRLRVVSAEPTWGSMPWTVRSRPETKPRVGCLTDWSTQAPRFGCLKGSVPGVPNWLSWWSIRLLILRL